MAIVSDNLRVSVTSEIGAEMMLFRLRDVQPVGGTSQSGSETRIVGVGEAGPRLAGLNGKPLTAGIARTGSCIGVLRKGACSSTSKSARETASSGLP